LELDIDQKSNFIELYRTLEPVARISKLFALLIVLRSQQNYFDSPTKSLSDLYPAKFVGSLAKSFFPYI